MPEEDSVVSVSKLEELDTAADLHAVVAGECSRLNLLAIQAKVQPAEPTPEQTMSIRSRLVSKLPQEVKFSHLCDSKKAFQTLVKGLEEEDTSLMKLLDFCTCAPLTHPNPLRKTDMTIFTRN